jgi:succinate dehydrogenase / fumarate reductase membrane anchor subunit
MSLQSPLNKVLGLGSAKQGSAHWWAQRLTAVGLVPLGLWFSFSLLGLPHGNYYLVAAWIAEPAHAILLILLVFTLVYHSSLGMQVVIEDYIHVPGAKVLVLVAVQFLHVILAVGGVYAVMLVSVGAGP